MKKEKTIDIIIIIIFLIILFAPSILFFFLKDKIGVDKSENRKLAKKPQIEIKTIIQYPELYNTYYNDNFPFRGNIKKIWTDINFWIFGDSTSKKVLIGKKENENMRKTWLFYCASEDGNPVEEAQGINQFSDLRKNQMYDIIVSNTKELEKRNIRAYYLICPNKENIYKEKLPDLVKIFSESKTDKLVKELQEKGITNIIYPKEELMNEKKNGQLYYKQDTHWNSHGAYIGFKKAMSIIEPNYQEPNYQIEEKKDVVENRDLVHMLGKNDFFLDDEPIVKIEGDGQYKTNTIKTATNDITITENENADFSDTIMIIGDSYRSATIPFFAKTYKKCVFLHRADFKNEMINEYMPNVVIFENVERYTEGAIKQIKIKEEGL